MAEATSPSANVPVIGMLRLDATAKHGRPSNRNKEARAATPRITPDIYIKNSTDLRMNKTKQRRLAHEQMAPTDGTMVPRVRLTRIPPTTGPRSV